MSVSPTFRMALAGEFEAQARWREEKADEFPDDPRNKNSAASLHMLAEVAENDYEDEDRIIERLYDLTGQWAEVPIFSEMGRDLISRFGFDRRGVRWGSGERGATRPECAAFLSKLVQVEQGERTLALEER
jgi:hypothetical protein